MSVKLYLEQLIFPFKSKISKVSPIATVSTMVNIFNPGEWCKVYEPMRILRKFDITYDLPNEIITKTISCPQAKNIRKKHKNALSHLNYNNAKKSRNAAR